MTANDNEQLNNVSNDVNNVEQTTNDVEQITIDDGFSPDGQSTDTLADPYLSELSDVKVKKKNSKAQIAINVALWVAIIVLSVLVVLRLFVFNSVGVSGESMTPTYAHGEVVVVNKVVKPNRGDVVVFYLNDVDNKFKAMFAGAEKSGEGQPYEKLIKRVVATEGDKIWVEQVSVGTYRLVVQPNGGGDLLYEDNYTKNGELLDESTYYIYSLAPTGLGVLQGTTEQNPLTVSEGCFFAMGDHRINSRDSREFGEFPLDRLFGVVINR
ncbi:MAG: signal peptidase I [Clostridia bacterium]|nr:signal peptidase I [Clostridia bacterium]